MTMMCIRIMRVFVRHPLMPVPMTMTLIWRQRFGVGVLMVGIVRMLVFVFDRDVCVLMLMPLLQMLPHAQRHQNASRGEWNRHRFLQNHYRDQSACKRGDRKIRSCARCTKFSQRYYE